MVFFILGVVGGLILFKNKITSVVPNFVQVPSPEPTKFLLENPPKESLVGKITSLSGDVSWQSRVDSTPSAIVAPRNIQQGEKIETGDNGKAVINFAGVSEINVFPNSGLSFVQTLPVNLVIAQKKGRSEYIKTGIIPLTVRSLHLIVEVTNSDLVVTVDEEKQVVTLEVRQGTATFAFNDLYNLSHLGKLDAGRQYVFRDRARKGLVTLLNNL